MTAFLWQCSVNIENPVQDTQEKINAEIPATVSILKGRWKGKSIISEGGTSQSNLTDVKLDFLHDETFILKDAGKEVFSSVNQGKISLSNNTLTLYNELGQSALKFLVTLSFQGNFLKLAGNTDEKEIFFVRDALPLKEDWPQILLDKGQRFWEYRGWRHKTSDQMRPATFGGNFYYIRFIKSALLVETNQNGIVDSTFPGWELRSDTLILTQGTVEKYLMDYHGTDSLRLWPLDGVSHLGIAGLNAGSLDYVIFQLVPARSKNYRNLNYLTQYWRGDTINGVERHYGNYYDMKFSQTGAVTVETATAGRPDFSAWQLLNGKIQLKEKAASQFSNYNIDKLTGSNSPLKLKIDGPLIRGVFSAVDPDSFAKDPLKRFPDRSFITLKVNGKTYEFFFQQKYMRDSAGFDKVEMSHFSDSAKGKAAFTAKQGEYRSSEPGFRFAFEFQRENSNALFYFCDTNSGGPSMRITGAKVNNGIEGKITESHVVDDMGDKHAIEGKFRYSAENRIPLTHEFWKKIPQKN